MASSCSTRRRHRRLLLAGANERTALVVVKVILLCTSGAAAAANGCDLTSGFAKVDLQEGHFVVQSPYDVPVDQRYCYDTTTGVRTFWVYAADKAFNAVTPTNPRTEVRLAGHDYSSGVWQFEGDVYVPAGTSGTSVVQIHNENGGTPATTMMLHVYNGTMRWYSGQEVERCVYDRWVRVNVVHDVGASTVAVYVAGAPRVAAVAVAPSRSHYFKFGVYMQHHDVSPLMEARWRNVSVYTKPY